MVRLPLKPGAALTDEARTDILQRNALWHKRQLPFLKSALNELTIHNFHPTIDWKNKNTIETGSHYFWGGGMVGGGLPTFGGLATFRGLLLLGFINGHNFLMLLSEGRYFQGVVTFRSLWCIYMQQNQLCLNASTPVSTVVSLSVTTKGKLTKCFNHMLIRNQFPDSSL